MVGRQHALLERFEEQAERERIALAHAGKLSHEIRIMGQDHRREEVGDGRWYQDTIAPGEYAEIVRELFERYATGNYSYARLADAINPRGGKHLRTEAVRDILSNRAYCGFVSSGGREF